jgi:hypothetical protein
MMGMTLMINIHALAARYNYFINITIKENP